MNLTLNLSADEDLALRRLAAEEHCELEVAARAVLRDWLIGSGYLELAEGDNDNDGEG